MVPLAAPSGEGLPPAPDPARPSPAADAGAAHRTVSPPVLETAADSAFDVVQQVSGHVTAAAATAAPRADRISPTSHSA